MSERRPVEESPSIGEVAREFDVPATDGALPPPAEASDDVVESVKEKVESVTRAELEAFLSQAVRLFLRGGLHVHHEGRATPDLELKVTEDTVVVNLRNLDHAVAWTLADGPADVPPPTEDQLLDRWRLFVLLEDEPVAALGRGIPGVQLKTGKASFLLFKDFVKALLMDKREAEREKEAARRRELLEEEMAESRRRTGAEVPDLYAIEREDDDLPAGRLGRPHG